MKNRKRIVVAFLICAVMLLGVGFAAITGELTITGTASSQAQHFKVAFTQVAATIVDGENDGVAVTAYVENEKVNSGDAAKQLGAGQGLTTVSLRAENMASEQDSVTFVFTITNYNNVTMYLTSEVTGNSLFSVTTSFADTSVAAEGQDGSTTTLTVIVKLIDDAIDESATESFTIKVNATSQEPASQQ